jgi:hypoxanthine phosphoribosyltransferase
MDMMKNDMTEFLSPEQVAGLVDKVAKQIQRDHEGQELVLICPLKGSCLFAADLSRRLELPVVMDFVLANPTEKGGAVRMTKDISVNITGRNVLIVEEIIDSGRTLSALKSRLLLAKPRSCRIVTLLDKPARRDIPLQADYIGMTVDDRYLVGYGMDSEELGRNYAGIYYFKQ